MKSRFLRGLANDGGDAIATVSLPRDGGFGGLALQGELRQRDIEPWCGLSSADRLMIRRVRA